MTQRGNLGALLVSVGTDLTDLNKGLKQADASVKDFEQSGNESLLSFKNVGIGVAIAVGAAFIKLSKDTIQYGQTLHQLSVQSGLTAQELARLEFITSQTDSSFQGVLGSVKFLSRAMFEAVNGNQEFRRLFKQLGIDITDSNGKLRNATDIIYEMGPALQRLGNETEMVAIGSKLLGRSFQENIGFFRATQEQIDGMQKKNINATDKLNEFATVVDSLSDKFVAWGLSIKNFLAEQGLPFLKWLDQVTESASKQGEEMRKNMEALRATPDMQRFLAGGGPGNQVGTQPVSPLPGAPAQGGQTPGFTGGGGLAAQGAANAGLQAPPDFVEWQKQMTEEMSQNNNPWKKMTEDMQEFNQKFFDFKDGIMNAWTGLMEGFVDGFGNAFADMIVDGKDFGESMEKVFKDLAKTVIAEIAKMIAKWLAWQAIKKVGNMFGIPFLREGGTTGNGLRRGGAIHAADGVAVTPNMGERGIPAVLHPNEIVSPIDKFFDFVKGMKGDTLNIYPSGRAADDPYALAAALALETDRRRRRP